MSFALLFTLSAIGISEAAYLVRKRSADQAPVCVIGGGCTKVLESKYNRIFFIPNDILGLFFYMSVAIITAFLVIGIGPLEWWSTILGIMVGFGALFSVFLVYLQGEVIHAWCFWCLMSAITIWLMAFILLFHL